MTSIILSFDIGIKNLAFCCLKKEDSKFEILDWKNVNLIEEEPKEKQTCLSCKSSAKFIGAGKPFCTRHCPALLQPIKDVSGNVYKKLPKLTTLQEILISKNGVKVPLKGDRIMEEIQKHYSVPVVIVKKANANTTSLDVIHDALRDLVLKNQDLWKKCTLICLENQPAFKNPTMKTVQVLLYATLRDILQPNPPSMHLIHAGKKIKGIKIQNNNLNAFMKTDVIIDFSTPKSSIEILNFAKKLKKKIIIGTTGFNKKEEKLIKNF